MREKRTRKVPNSYTSYSVSNLETLTDKDLYFSSNYIAPHRPVLQIYKAFKTEIGIIFVGAS